MTLYGIEVSKLKAAEPKRNSTGLRIRSVAVVLALALLGAAVCAVPLHGELENLPAWDPEELESLTRVDLNTADMEDFCMLPGVGRLTAERLLLYRMTNGLYHSVREAENVYGVSKSLVDGWGGMAYVSLPEYHGER